MRHHSIIRHHLAAPYKAPTARIVRDSVDVTRDYFIPLATAWKLEAAGKLVQVSIGNGYQNAFMRKDD